MVFCGYRRLSVSQSLSDCTVFFSFLFSPWGTEEIPLIILLFCYSAILAVSLLHHCLISDCLPDKKDKKKVRFSPQASSYSPQSVSSLSLSFFTLSLSLPLPLSPLSTISIFVVFTTLSLFIFSFCSTRSAHLSGAPPKSPLQNGRIRACHHFRHHL